MRVPHRTRLAACALFAVSAAVPLPGAAVQGGLNGHALAFPELLRGLDVAPDEAALVAIIDQVRQGRLGDALAGAEALVRRNPRFRLAQLVYADLLLARTRPLGRFGAAPGAQAAGVEALLDEARSRLRHYRAVPPPGSVPGNVLKLSGSQPRAVVVDVARSRLYVFENRVDGPALVDDLYVSSGKNGAGKRREGDQRTPVGVYFTTGSIGTGKLPDFYGRGAFPVNYPNEWDMRLGRTGYGIWIHGVPSDTYSRAPRASDGCMALTNADLGSIWSKLDAVNTPVIIAEQVAWADRGEVALRAAALEGAIERWRRDWESRDHDRYAGHYSRSFSADDSGRAAWMRHKRRVNAAKSYIRVALSDLSMFAYPGEADVVVVTFDQDYRSSNYSERSRKRQYWALEGDGRWRIVYEGDARFREVHLRGIPYSARSGMVRLAP